MSAKNCTVVLLVGFLLVALLCGETQAQGVDDTVKPGTFGTTVVEATVRKLDQLTERNAQLQADNRFIRRIAWVETADGTAPDTYSDPAYHGGIWRVDQPIFSVTKRIYNDAVYASIFAYIEDEFCINWGTVTWSDCRKPLYSALAARLYFHSVDPSPIPNGVENQAAKWKAEYNSRSTDTAESFVMKVSELEETGCDTQGIDLIFVMDGSGSVTSSHFNTTKTFVQEMVDFFEIGADKVRVGVIQYSSSPRTEFHLNQYTDKNLLKQAVSNITYARGNTRTGLAIDTMVTNFSPEYGARPPNRGIPRVGVVITDGKSGDSVKRPADTAREQDIVIFAIGVTSSVDSNELNDIANKPNDTYVFHVDDFDVISTIGASLEYATCDRSEPIANETVNSTLDRGQRQNFQVPVTNDGASIILDANSGTAVAYLSITTPVPNESHHDFKLNATSGTSEEIFISPDLFTKICDSATVNNRRRKRQAGNQGSPGAEDTIGTVYMSIEGLEDTNDFVLMVAEGDVTTPKTTLSTTATMAMTTNGCGSIRSTTALTIAGCCVSVTRLVSYALYRK